MRLLTGLSLGSLLLLPPSLFGVEPDLSEYRSVDKAIADKTGKAHAIIGTKPAYLGLEFAVDSQGRLTVDEVAVNSPAAKAGCAKGDVIVAVDGKNTKDDDDVRDIVKSNTPGSSLKLEVTRNQKKLNLTATLGTLSIPMVPSKARTVVGVQIAPVKQGEGVVIEQVVAGSPAERARLKVGEVILKIDDVDVGTVDKFNDAVAAKQPEDSVTLTLLLAEKKVDMKMSLRPAARGNRRGGGSPGGSGGWDTRVGRYWSKPTYRIAIINVEYPDEKHDSRIPAKAWEDAMFSTTGYKTTATGQVAHGSMHDYYWEQSYGQLKVEGKSFEHVEVGKKRGEYEGNRNIFFNEAMDKLLAREGKDALKGFDGVFFIYAGDRFPNAPRGGLYWPHRASFNYKGTRWDYFICSERSNKNMSNISVFCHEFGHLLGLPDLYARPENPGSEGVGIWCAMSNQAGGGRPQQFCAWSKLKLGWIKPTTIDPSVKQKLILSPIEDSNKECFKVLARPDGSEYFLLEYRKKKGFDASLPAEGLLIWRVIGDKPILEESHGVEGPAGPRSFLSSVPFPSPSNNSFTPFTIPSSRSLLDGGLPVYITNIQRLSDGRISFQIGYEYQ